MARRNVIRLTALLVNISWYILVIGLLVVSGFAVFGALFPSQMTRIMANSTLELRGLGLSLGVPMQGLELGAVRTLFGMLSGFGLAAMALAFIVGNQLRGILRTTSSGTPFVSENVARVRAIGLAVLGWAVLKTLVEATLGVFLMIHLKWPGLELNAKVDPSAEAVIFGLLILVLAEVFRYGIALQEEHDLTV